jgi:methylated-DNA-[protein]-cysteine S-methyltransferase
MPLYVYQTQLGRITIEEQHDSITEIYFNDEALPASVDVRATALTNEAAKQLNAYLAGTLKTFSLPLAPVGTEFQKKIWRLLCDIPYGTTCSYKDLALAVQNPKAVRAVGQANNKNPIPVFIPCHRVIGANGKLVGYSGGLAMKQQLLTIERHSTAC